MFITFVGSSKDKHYPVNFNRRFYVIVIRGGKVKLGYVTLSYVMLHHITSCHGTARHVMALHGHVMSRHVMSRHVTSRPCHVMPRRIMLRYVTLSYVYSTLCLQILHNSFFVKIHWGCLSSLDPSCFSMWIQGIF